nr:zf-CCHC domain-containing protein/DUF4219 domain-containing protein/UBN2 domain-containing protein [Tanacetum cinerariifolium]
MCKTAKDIWQSLLITHQGNSQVKDNKTDILLQQYEQFTILEEEYIDSGFARFNTIITNLKALDEGFSSKNYVRKFLMAVHPKWREKVTTIKELKELLSLALDELIDNLKVHEVVMEKDFEIYRGKKEKVKSISLKAKKESSDDETSTFGSGDKEYSMAVRNFKKFLIRKGNFVRQPREEKKSFRQRDEKKGKSDRKCFRCGDPNHLIGDYPKPSHNKDQRPSLEVLGVIAKMTPKTKPTMKLVSWLNRQMSKTKIMSFVGSSAENTTDGSTIKGHGSNLYGFVSRKDDQNGTEYVFSPPMSFRSDFVITRKKLIHNSIDESKKPSLKPSPKADDQNGTEYVFSPPMSFRSDFVITRKKLIHNSIDESKKLSLKPSPKAANCAGVAVGSGCEKSESGGKMRKRKCGEEGLQGMARNLKVGEQCFESWEGQGKAANCAGVAVGSGCEKSESGGKMRKRKCGEEGLQGMARNLKVGEQCFESWEGQG